MRAGHENVTFTGLTNIHLLAGHYIFWFSLSRDKIISIIILNL